MPHVTACADSAYVGLAPIAQLLLSWCPSVLQRPRIFCVLSQSPASIGCAQQLLRSRAHIYAFRTKSATFFSQAPVGSSASAALVVAQ